jgi:uncharacterized membrane protein
MSAAHLHLLLNHFPTVGTVIGIGLFLLSFARRNDDLTRASLAILVVIALTSVLVFFTGYAARETIQDRPDVSADLLEAHLNAALLALILMGITGVLSWVGLWQFRRTSRPARSVLSALLLLSIVTLAIMAGTATMGGEIRHPEIRSDQAMTVPVWFTITPIAEFMNGPWWVWAWNEVFHFVGLALLSGVALVLNLRLLGMMKSVSFAALDRLLPWGVLGFGINLVTGILFFIGTPEQYTMNPAFYWKMMFVLPAVGTFLYFTMSERIETVGPAAEAPPLVKLVAAASLFLWAGVLYFGRMLPYIGESF